MTDEPRRTEHLFETLMQQPRQAFPQKRGRLEAPTSRGVYVIRKRSTNRVVHVGRTLRARRGIAQRLKNHLQGNSSFSQEFLGGDGSTLRNGDFTYQCLAVEDPRERTLLEAYAIAHLCPEHLGLGLGER